MSHLDPVTPGELLFEEFLKPLGISTLRLSREIGVAPRQIEDIIGGGCPITADTDLRLCRFFGLSRGYWLRAQVEHDTELAQVALSDTLEQIVPWAEQQPDARGPA